MLESTSMFRLFDVSFVSCFELLRGVRLNADVAVGFNPAQDLAGPQHHRGRHAGESGGLDAVAAVGAAADDPVQEAQG